MTTRQHRGPDDADSSDCHTMARHMADRLCQGFVHHDRREREAAVEAFAAVDRLQFAHADESNARRAAEAYVDALWAKDALEDACRIDGDIDAEQLDAADWSTVEAAFARRASAVGIDARYAPLTTEGWREHKTGGDYWTPMMHAQALELRAALQDPTYPDKPRHGRDGFGPEPARYVLGVELHDTRRWTEAREAMTPYFQFVLDERAETRARAATAPPLD